MPFVGQIPRKLNVVNNERCLSSLYRNPDQYQNSTLFPVKALPTKLILRFEIIAVSREMRHKCEKGIVEISEVRSLILEKCAFDLFRTAHQYLRGAH